jgi:hypothetical protein
VNSFPPDVWDIHKPHKTSCTTWFTSVQRRPGIRVRIPPHCTPLTPTCCDIFGFVSFQFLVSVFDPNKIIIVCVCHNCLTPLSYLGNRVTAPDESDMTCLLRYLFSYLAFLSLITYRGQKTLHTF